MPTHTRKNLRTMTLPTFCKGMTEERFDILLDLSSWMRSWSSDVEDTHHCDENYLELQQQGEELSQAIEKAGFTYEQVEEFTFGTDCK